MPWSEAKLEAKRANSARLAGHPSTTGHGPSGKQKKEALKSHRAASREARETDPVPPCTVVADPQLALERVACFRAAAAQETTPDIAPGARLAARLALQQAPIEAVLHHALPLVAANQQEDLIEALIRPPAFAALPRAYRHKLLKALATAPLPDDAEMHEALLHAFISPAPDVEAGWSCSTYHIGCGPPLGVRVFGGIGGGNETGGRVWDAALALSALLLATPTADEDALARPRAALELGAGPGLPGLVLASLGRTERVVLTDAVPATLENLQRNIARLPPKAASRCEVAHLDWHTPPSVTAAEFVGFDLILAADVVYEPMLVPPLLATIGALLGANRHATALLAAERRGEALATFETELAVLVESGVLRVVSERSEAARCALRDPGCPFYCAPDAIERIVLLELSAGDGGSAVAAAHASSLGWEGGAAPWRVVARVDACGSASVRATCTLRH